MSWKFVLAIPLFLVPISGAEAEPLALDPTNVVHCESALKFAALLAEDFDPENEPEISRHAALASAQVAVRFKPAEAAAIRERIGPLLFAQNGFDEIASACAARQRAEEGLADAESFAAAGRHYADCLKAAVQLGMRLRIDPAEFEAALPSKCSKQEAAFRRVAIPEAIRQGRTEDQARAEIDGNIARALAIYAADQASYVRTGRVPR